MTDAEHPLVEAFFQALRLSQMDQCQAALAEMETVATDDPSLLPWCSYLRGVLANERDQDWAAAERAFNALLDLPQPAPPMLQARALLALGITLGYLGRWPEIADVCTRSYEIYRGLGLHFEQANALKQAVVGYSAGFTQGNYGVDVLPAALERCQTALALLETNPAPAPRDAWLKGTLWNEAGILHKNLGQYDQAIAYYQLFLDNSRALNYHLGVGFALNNLAEAYHRLGQDTWPDALRCLHEAAALKKEHGNRYQEIETLANLAFLYGEMGDLPAAQRVYDELLELIGSLRAGASSEAARAGFQATMIDSYAHALLTAVRLGDLARAFEICEQARSRAFLDLLAAGSAGFLQAGEGQTASLAAVQAALPPDAMLLEYFSTGLIEARDRRGSGLQPQRHRLPPAKTILFAVTHDAWTVYDLDLSPNDLMPQRLHGPSERHFLQPAVRRTLYDRLIAPATSLLAGKRRLVIVPHGPLHYVPFQALIAPDGETLLRPGGPELVYGPSASVLFRDRAAARPSRLQKTSKVTDLPCLALGFDGEGEQRLRFAEEEAGRIAALLGGEALLGPAGKREALFRRGPLARYLHISCHGQFDPAAPLESSLHLGASETLTARDVLASLRLNCDLVTLSACESGLSQVRRGDELMGLVRAFLAAGAPAVIATLWRVDERSTRLLMEQFYREVAAGATFARALQQAQLFLRSLRRQEALDLLGGDAPGVAGPEQPFADPFYWAPFVLIGDEISEVAARG
jgi:CHAT domain-containing protein/tetratricopeptide (TPR) repeat protein